MCYLLIQLNPTLYNWTERWLVESGVDMQDSKSWGLICQYVFGLIAIYFFFLLMRVFGSACVNLTNFTGPKLNDHVIF